MDKLSVNNVARSTCISFTYFTTRIRSCVASCLWQWKFNPNKPPAEKCNAVAISPCANSRKRIKCFGSRVLEKYG
ncbi:hypothetical protein Trydic_g6793 [Trypoxylus dichotomus]